MSTGRTIVSILVAGVLLGIASFLWHERRAPKTAEQRQAAADEKQTAFDNSMAGFMANFTHDGRLFIQTTTQGSSDTQTVIRHPNCSRRQLPDPSVLEWMQGKQYIPYGKYIEGDQPRRTADPVER